VIVCRSDQPFDLGAGCRSRTPTRACGYWTFSENIDGPLACLVLADLGAGGRPLHPRRLGLPELAADARFATVADRVGARDVLTAIIEARLATGTSD
jgi:crotonobetainyl-CoA:carnitine CoA-transferase CaiB-like acyl-CoA transferase